jgi:hypothetical protein
VLFHKCADFILFIDANVKMHIRCFSQTIVGAVRLKRKRVAYYSCSVSDGRPQGRDHMGRVTRAVSAARGWTHSDPESQQRCPDQRKGRRLE